jgi:hypothetical protein
MIATRLRDPKTLRHHGVGFCWPLPQGACPARVRGRQKTDSDLFFEITLFFVRKSTANGQDGRGLLSLGPGWARNRRAETFPPIGRAGNKYPNARSLKRPDRSAFCKKDSFEPNLHRRSGLLELKSLESQLELKGVSSRGGTLSQKSVLGRWVVLRSGRSWWNWRAWDSQVLY